jgi:hypothetical protein
MKILATGSIVYAIDAYFLQPLYEIVDGRIRFMRLFSPADWFDVALLGQRLPDPRIQPGQTVLSHIYNITLFTSLPEKAIVVPKGETGELYFHGVTAQGVILRLYLDFKETADFPLFVIPWSKIDWIQIQRWDHGASDQHNLLTRLKWRICKLRWALQAKRRSNPASQPEPSNEASQPSAPAEATHSKEGV